MRAWLVLAIVIGLVGACSGQTAESAQLPVSTVVIDTPKGPATFHVEVATDQRSWARGLMYRTAMAADAGMLFSFDGDAYRSFWMKNTILPLDMLFIRRDGTISSIYPNAEPYSTYSIRSLEPVRAVLEINGGRAAALGIVPGQIAHNLIFHNVRAAR